MDRQKFLFLMQELNGQELPALRGVRGRSANIAVDGKSVRFTRNDAPQSANINMLVDAFNLLEEGTSLQSEAFDGVFNKNWRAKSFFFQLLRYFDIADVIRRKNSYVIEKK